MTFAPTPIGCERSPELWQAHRARIFREYPDAICSHFKPCAGRDALRCEHGAEVSALEFVSANDPYSLMDARCIAARLAADEAGHG